MSPIRPLGDPHNLYSPPSRPLAHSQHVTLGQRDATIIVKPLGAAVSPVGIVRFADPERGGRIDVQA